MYPKKYNEKGHVECVVCFCSEERISGLNSPFSFLLPARAACLKSWTPDLQRILKYDVNAARKNDNGEFWIDFKSMQHFWDVAYLSWTPELFNHNFTVQHHWHQKVSCYGLGSSTFLKIYH